MSKTVSFDFRKWADDATWSGNYVTIFEQRASWSAILDFYISPEALKTVKIDQKVIETIK